MATSRARRTRALDRSEPRCHAAGESGGSDRGEDGGPVSGGAGALSFDGRLISRRGVKVVGCLNYLFVQAARRRSQRDLSRTDAELRTKPGELFEPLSGEQISEGVAVSVEVGDRDVRGERAPLWSVEEELEGLHHERAFGGLRGQCLGGTERVGAKDYGRKRGVSRQPRRAQGDDATLGPAAAPILRSRRKA